MAVKAIILIGGPNKGQRFRPLSFDSPKYMFPIGGQAILGHLIESCLTIKDLSEILLLGFYQQDGMLSQDNLQKLVHKFCSNTEHWTNRQTPQIRYLQEFTRMGTAGGMYHFRDQIRHGDPEAFLVINGDVCGDFDFGNMLVQHRSTTELSKKLGSPMPYVTVMTTEAGRQESLSYGCIVENPESHIIEHYVEKPSTFVSNLISCGAYLCNIELLHLLETTIRKKRQDLASGNSYESNQSFTSSTIQTESQHFDYLSLECDILQQCGTQPRCYSYRTQGSWWCQIKTAASAIYANRQYLNQYIRANRNCQFVTERCDPGVEKCQTIGNVYIHPTAKIDPSSVIGPNVSIMENCIVGPGVRVRESILLQNSIVDAHTLVLCAIVGWNCRIGTWVRVEGTPSEPDPNQKNAKVRNQPLFNADGKLNPSIAVLGSNVKISGGTVIINTIVLPHKDLSRSYKNEIVL